MEYYREGLVTVDQDFARFGSKSYAINKINTVDVRSRKPYGWGVMILGVFAVIIGFGLTPLSLFAAVLLIAGGLVVVFLGWQRSQTIVYDLFLKTSSNDVQAYETRDEDEVVRLRVAVEKAMMGR